MTDIAALTECLDRQNRWWRRAASLALIGLAIILLLE